jgi:hypothetical protein
MPQRIKCKAVSKDRLVNFVHSPFRNVLALKIQDLLVSIPFFKNRRRLSKGAIFPVNDHIRFGVDIVRSPAVQLVADLVQDGSGLEGMRIRQDGHVELRADALQHFNKAFGENLLDGCQH